MKEAVIVSACRTPMGRFLGKMSGSTASELGAIVLRDVMKRAGLESRQVDEVIMGNVVSAGVGQAPARQAALQAGFPETVAALTINKVCGSGLKSVMLAATSIRAGDADIVAAGGMESMSNAPYLMRGIRGGVKFGDQRMLDGLIFDGLWDAQHQTHMGNFADYTASKAQISRQEQDQFALESHQKAIAARDSLQDEITAYEVKDRSGKIIDTLLQDENPREDSSLEKLNSLPPVFSKDGTVTAGNASPLTDGAAAVLVMSRSKAQELQLTPLAVIEAYSVSGVAPKEIFFGPAQAIQQVVSKLGMNSVNDFDLIEVNEAFAAQALANEKELGWDRKKLNVHGGAIALGHPLGASGTRVLVTLLHALRKRGGGRGITALCLGGGNAVSLAIRTI